MKPTQEWPSVTENQFQDRTENYTESQSIRVSFIRTCKGINAILTANVQGIAFFFPLETKRENHVPQNCRRNLLRPCNVFLRIDNDENNTKHNQKKGLRRQPDLSRYCTHLDY